MLPASKMNDDEDDDDDDNPFWADSEKEQPVLKQMLQTQLI